MRLIGRRTAVRIRDAYRNQMYRGLVFLGIIVLVVGFGIQVPTNENQSNGESTSDHGAPAYHPKKISFWVRTITDPIATFTFILSASSIGLWIVTWSGMRAQSRDMKQSLRISDQTAAAAKRSADALYASEQARIVENITNPMVETLFRSGEWYRNSPSMDAVDYPPASVSLTIRFKNYGKTPATIISYSAEPTIKEHNPIFDPPEFSVAFFGEKRLIEYTIAPMDSTGEISITRVMPDSWAQSNNLARRQLTIWIIGHVTFIDVFDEKITRKFTWRYDRPMRAFVPFDFHTSREKKN